MLNMMARRLGAYWRPALAGLRAASFGILKASVPNGILNLSAGIGIGGGGCLYGLIDGEMLGLMDGEILLLTDLDGDIEGERLRLTEAETLRLTDIEGDKEGDKLLLTEGERLGLIETDGDGEMLRLTDIEGDRLRLIEAETLRLIETDGNKLTETPLLADGERLIEAEVTVKDALAKGCQLAEALGEALVSGILNLNLEIAALCKKGEPLGAFGAEIGKVIPCPRASASDFAISSGGKLLSYSCIFTLKSGCCDAGSCLRISGARTRTSPMSFIRFASGKRPVSWKVNVEVTFLAKCSPIGIVLMPSMSIGCSLNRIP